MIPTGDNHNPAVIDLITDDFRIPEIPSARVSVILAGVLDNDGMFLRISPSPASICTVSQTNLLVPILRIRCKRCIIGDQSFTACVGEQARGIG
ncbi:hypothetical protein D3C81_1785280 [compost metagenome]